MHIKKIGYIFASIKRTFKKHFSPLFISLWKSNINPSFQNNDRYSSHFLLYCSKKIYYFRTFFTFNLFLITNYKWTRNERKKHVRKQGKKTVKRPSEKAVNNDVSTIKNRAGRPESGVIEGIRPKCRKDVIREILSWKEKKYFQEDNPTSTKALAQWTYTHFDFRADSGNKLSLSTIEQIFGEVWREEHLEISIQKRAKKEERKKKRIHTN